MRKNLLTAWESQPDLHEQEGRDRGGIGPLLFFNAYDLRLLSLSQAKITTVKSRATKTFRKNLG